MLRSRVIPVLLMKNNGLYKTQNFSNPKYIGDPINTVRIFNEKKVDELIIYDIGASFGGSNINFALLEEIAKNSRMPLCYGGGIKSAEDARRILTLGYEKVSLSRSAVLDRSIITQTSKAIGTQSTVVTIDVKKSSVLSGSKYYVTTLSATERHKLDPVDFAVKCAEEGAGEIVINIVDRDGMCTGYDMDFARRVCGSVTVPVTLCGGAGSLHDIRQLIDELGPIGAAAGSFFVFNGKYRAVLISYARP